MKPLDDGEAEEVPFVNNEPEEPLLCDTDVFRGKHLSRRLELVLQPLDQSNQLPSARGERRDQHRMDTAVMPIDHCVRHVNVGQMLLNQEGDVPPEELVFRL